MGPTARRDCRRCWTRKGGDDPEIARNLLRLARIDQLEFLGDRDEENLEFSGIDARSQLEFFDHKAET